MQRTLLIGLVLSSFCLTVSGQTQTRGSYAMGGGHSAGLAPVGSVGRAPIVPPFGRPLPVAPGNGYGYGYGRNGYGRHGGYGYGIAAYPIYVGGFGGDYYPGYTDPSLAVAPAPAPQAPPVVINQYFSSPPPDPAGPPLEDSDVHVYSQPSQALAAAAPEPRSYLIAYKDHSVYSALAYWVEDHTLHYVTTQNTHNQADVNLIDLEFTKKLNQDRNMPFSLTPAQR